MQKYKKILFKGGVMHLMVEGSGGGRSRRTLWLLSLLAAYFLVAGVTTFLSGLEEEALLFEVDVCTAAGSTLAFLFLLKGIFSNKSRRRGGGVEMVSEWTFLSCNNLPKKTHSSNKLPQASITHSL
jgi:hypothetical protein